MMTFDERLNQAIAANGWPLRASFSMHYTLKSQPRALSPRGSLILGLVRR
jgi:hypothetical protein